MNNSHAMLDKFSDASSADNRNGHTISDKIAQLGKLLPGGLASGAMAGGLMTLLLGKTSARKFAGTAATLGGAAILGGLAYKACKNWQESKQDNIFISENSFMSADIVSADYQLTIVKAMIAATRADGQFDEAEQQRIFEAVENMQLSTDLKETILDLLQRNIKVSEIAMGAVNLEQKTELYLVSCMIINLDNPPEKKYLDDLAEIMNLPPELRQQLQYQAKQTMANA